MVNYYNMEHFNENLNYYVGSEFFNWLMFIDFKDMNHFGIMVRSISDPPKPAVTLNRLKYERILRESLYEELSFELGDIFDTI